MVSACCRLGQHSSTHEPLEATKPLLKQHTSPAGESSSRGMGHALFPFRFANPSRPRRPPWLVPTLEAQTVFPRSCFEHLEPVTVRFHGFGRCDSLQFPPRPPHLSLPFTVRRMMPGRCRWSGDLAGDLSCSADHVRIMSYCVHLRLLMQPRFGQHRAQQRLRGAGGLGQAVLLIFWERAAKFRGGSRSSPIDVGASRISTRRLTGKGACLLAEASFHGPVDLLPEERGKRR